MERDETESTLKTIDTAVDIVAALQELDGAGASRLADYLDMSPSTVHGYLQSLEKREYLRSEGGVYYVGLKFLEIGAATRFKRKEYDIVREHLGTIAETTSERAQYIVEEHGRGIYLIIRQGEHAIQLDRYQVGSQNDLHASAAGKAILANLPRDRRDEIIERRELPDLAENTITDRGDLENELATIRDRGVSYNRQESLDGVNAVGVPVTTSQDRVLGALSVSGPLNRIKGERMEEDLTELLLGVANEIEVNLSY